jgi:transcriptional regulator with XRE-family HTH domain
MTQTELAEAIGESKQTIYKYEKGIITNIPLSKVEAIAKVLKCPPVALTGWRSQKEIELDEQHELLLSLFDRLPPESRAFVLAQLRGAVQSQKAQGDR